MINKKQVVLSLLCLGLVSYASLAKNNAPKVDIKNPSDLFAKKQDMKVFNFGSSANYSLGVQNSYDQIVRVKSELVSFEMKFLYNPVSWASIYSRAYLDTSAYPSDVSDLGYFSDALSNSRIAFADAYVLLGDKKEYPFYMYFGQTRLPFANAYSFSSATNLVNKAFQVTQRAVSLGRSSENESTQTDVQLFTFTGNTYYLNGSKGNIQTFGLNFVTKFLDKSKSFLEFSAGYLSNIAESDGFQKTAGYMSGSAPSAEFDYNMDTDTPEVSLVNLDRAFIEFNGFATNKKFQGIHKKVDGIALGMKTSPIKDVTVSFNFATALKSFDYRDLVYRANGVSFLEEFPQSNDGANINAWNVYLAKRFINADLYFGFEQTSQAFALNLPSHRLVCGVSKDINAFSNLSFELRQDKNYAKNAYALGAARVNVIAANPVHVDGIADAPAYSLIDSAEDLSERNAWATSAVLSLKVKF